MAEPAENVERSQVRWRVWLALARPSPYDPSDDRGAGGLPPAEIIPSEPDPDNAGAGMFALALDFFTQLQYIFASFYCVEKYSELRRNY